jgi:hypothetical protein
MNVPFSVKFKLVAHKDTGLRAASRILAKELRGGLIAVGTQLVKSSRVRMRKDSGDTQRSLRSIIEGQGLNLSLDVSSDLVQAFVDAYGLHRGIFPPYKPGTRIYSWAGRKISGGLEVRGTTNKIPLLRVRATPHGPALPKHRNVRRFKASKIRTIRNSEGLLQQVRPVGPPARNKTQNAKIRKLAFLIARAIYRRGLKGSQWNIKALQVNERYIVNQLQNALYRATNVINRG